MRGAPPTRQRTNKCTVYVEKDKPSVLGGNLSTLIDNQTIAIEHFCSNEQQCLSRLRSQLASGQMFDFSLNKVANKTFKNKLRVCVPISRIT